MKKPLIVGLSGAWGGERLGHPHCVCGDVVSVDISLKLLSPETRAKVQTILGLVCSSVHMQLLSIPWGLPLGVSEVDSFPFPASTLATPILTAPGPPTSLHPCGLTTQTLKGPVNTHIRPCPASAELCPQPPGLSGNHSYLPVAPGKAPQDGCLSSLWCHLPLSPLACWAPFTLASLTSSHEPSPPPLGPPRLLFCISPTF